MGCLDQTLSGEFGPCLYPCKHISFSEIADVSVTGGTAWNINLDIVCFLLGNSPASEVYMPTFRNTLSVPSSQCSETSAYKLQMAGNYPKENIQHLEHGESLKSRNLDIFTNFIFVYFVF
jgi:hypothetical protein